MSNTKTVMKYLLAFLFVAAGINHFIKPDMYLKIMPPYLPWPLFLQYLAGFFEILLGILVLIPRYSRMAAWGLILLLIAVFPANIQMALNPDKYPEFSPMAYYLRLPIQFVIIAWAWWYTKNNANTA
ncbi:MAG: DoxX family membrane protein [Acidobacteria bacterium]|nr:DoxX family membrane protein [Acidobacteriota bacterium]